MAIKIHRYFPNRTATEYVLMRAKNIAISTEKKLTLTIETHNAQTPQRFGCLHCIGLIKGKTLVILAGGCSTMR